MLFRHEQNCNSGTYRFGMAMTGPCGDKEEGRDTEGVIKTASSFLKILGGDAADVEGGGATDLCECEGDILPRETIDLASSCSSSNRAASARRVMKSERNKLRIMWAQNHITNLVCLH
jgi:hypothetical protein